MPAKAPAGGRLDRQPQNPNKLQENKFRFAILKLPNVEYWTQAATLPGISQTPLYRETPLNKIPYGSTKLEFDPNFQLDFGVDEDLENYLEIFNWMVGITFPESYDQYKDLLKENELVAPRGVIPEAQIYSDARLLLYSSQFNINFEVVFEDIFPTSLSALEFTHKTEDAAEMTAQVNFVYRQFRIET